MYKKLANFKFVNKNKQNDKKTTDCVIFFYFILKKNQFKLDIKYFN